MATRGISLLFHLSSLVLFIVTHGAVVESAVDSSTLLSPSRRYVQTAANKLESQTNNVPRRLGTTPSQSTDDRRKEIRELNVDVSYKNNPSLKWSLQLQDTGKADQSTAERGAGVVLSPDDGLAYVTLSDGRLEVITISDSSRRWFYKPEPTPDRAVQCTSTVYFGETSNGNQFAVYAIMDVLDGSVPTSRIIAVSHPFNEILWISDSFDGEVVGTPIVTRPRSTGQYVYFVRNVASGSTPTEGHFTMLNAVSGAEVLSEAAGQFSVNDAKPYGPLGVAHDPVRGQYNGGETNTNDIVVWATSEDDGRSTKGYFRAFQMPMNFDGVSFSSLITKRLSDLNWNSVVPPTLTSNGLDIFNGRTSSTVEGLTTQKIWIRPLEASQGNSLQPIPNTLALSNAEDMLYVTSAGGPFYGIRTSDGEIAWQINTDSTVLSTARISPDDNRIYYVQSNHGVKSVSKDDGYPFWTVDCGTFGNGGCSTDIQAEFAISSHGLFLVYVDVLGKVTAFQVGDALSPTAAPAAYVVATPQPTFVKIPQPTGSEPTSPKPTAVPPTSIPSAMPTSTPTSSSVIDIVVQAPSIGNKNNTLQEATSDELGRAARSVIISFSAIAGLVFVALIVSILMRPVKGMRAARRREAQESATLP